jgi:hypothetical protein
MTQPASGCPQARQLGDEVPGEPLEEELVPDDELPDDELDDGVVDDVDASLGPAPEPFDSEPDPVDDADDDPDFARLSVR